MWSEGQGGYHAICGCSRTLRRTLRKSRRAMLPLGHDRHLPRWVNRFLVLSPFGPLTFPFSRADRGSNPRHAERARARLPLSQAEASIASE